MQQFVKGTGSFVSEMADLLLNGLTNGRHGKLVSQQQRRGEESVKKDRENLSASEGGVEGGKREHGALVEGEGSTKGREVKKELAGAMREAERQIEGTPEANTSSTQSLPVEGPGATTRVNVSQKYAGLLHALSQLCIWGHLFYLTLLS